MDIDEAIEHAEEVAEIKEKQVKNCDWGKGSLTERDCIKCAKEHRQLAGWLKELKVYRALKTETKKCPICGNDLYEYCFMCCYEGKKVKRNEID